MTSTVAEVATALRSGRYRYIHEEQFHDGLEQAMRRAGLAPAREVVIGPGSRIDFVVGRIGIEVKVAGSPLEVGRQLKRYAERPEIDELVLVTTRSTHLALGNLALAKPLTVVHLGGLR